MRSMLDKKKKLKVAIPHRIDAILFEHGFRGADNVEVTLVPPREIPRLLHEREVDAALAPSVMFFQGDYVIIPDAAISTFHRIGTELLVSRCKLEEVRSIAFMRQPDTSRTILEIVLRELFPEVPFKFEIGTGNPLRDLEKCDAAAISGSGAWGLAADIRTYDVGEFWVRLTELPAVFSLWLSPKELSEERRLEASKQVMEAKKRGLREIDRVVKLARERVTLSKYRLIEYLTLNVDYDLFSRQVKSLKLLGKMMQEYRLLPKGKEIDLEFATRRTHVSLFTEVFGRGDNEGVDDLLFEE